MSGDLKLWIFCIDYWYLWMTAVIRITINILTCLRFLKLAMKLTRETWRSEKLFVSLWIFELTECFQMLTENGLSFSWLFLNNWSLFSHSNWFLWHVLYLLLCSYVWMRFVIDDDYGMKYNEVLPHHLLKMCWKNQNTSCFFMFH